MAIEKIRSSYVVFLPGSCTQNLDRISDWMVFNISKPYRWGSRVCFLIHPKDCKIKLYRRFWNEHEPQAILLIEEKGHIRSFVTLIKSEKSGTYSYVCMYVVFFATFSDESTSQFINSGRYDLKSIVRFSEDRF